MSIVRTVICDFCGKPENEIGFYARGIDDRAHVCEGCVDQLSEAIAEKRAERDAAERTDNDGEPDTLESDEAPLVEAEVIG